MAKISTRLTSDFSEAHDKDEGGVTVGKVRVGVVRISSGGKAVAEIRCALDLPDDDDAKMVVGIYPLDVDNLGFKPGNELPELDAPVALAFIELMKTALPYLRRNNDETEVL